MRARHCKSRLPSLIRPSPARLPGMPALFHQGHLNRPSGSFTRLIAIATSPADAAVIVGLSGKYELERYRRALAFLGLTRNNGPIRERIEATREVMDTMSIAVAEIR